MTSDDLFTRYWLIIACCVSLLLGTPAVAALEGGERHTGHPAWMEPPFIDLETDLQTVRSEDKTGVMVLYTTMGCSYCAKFVKYSLEDLDGTFSYLVATRDAIGYAKDKLAAKPMVKYEDDDLIALASEEVGLNCLFPGRALDTSEPPPLTCGLWSRSS